MSCQFSKKAATDITNIYMSGAQNFGIAQADTYHAGLERVFEFLAENPLAVRESKEFLPPVRIHPYKAHVVVFKISGNGILIVRVLHGHQDLKRWL